MRNNAWRLFWVLFVLALSVFYIYPPKSRDLIEHFNKRAAFRDATLSNIVAQAQSLEKERPDHEYGNLNEAIGTNDITRYFYYFAATNQSKPTIYILNRLQREAAGKIHLGIDLQGGVSFVLSMDTNRLAELNTNENASVTVKSAIEHGVEVLRRRVDALGVAEPVIQPEGENRIRVQLPGLSEENLANATIVLSKPAYLEFRLVHPESSRLISEGTIPPGYQVLIHEAKASDGRPIAEKYVVEKRPKMVGGIKRAMVARGSVGQPEILFSLDDTGTKQFGKLTTEFTGYKMAVILDGELQTAPVIEEPIVGGEGRIRGDYTYQEANRIANVLENPLKAPLKIESSSTVDPTLGKDSIRSGVKASIVGVAAVAGFMLIYYMLAGAVANIALLLNIVILMGVICSIQATLTLPGIAGIVLTVGMAVDANVLIFERIREEAGKGKSLRAALSAGYDRAFGTIFDSHVTTLISSIILIWMGTGPIKGFGVSLTIGVAASLFTALVVTRLIFDWLLAKNILKSLPMLHVIRSTKLDFMKLAVPAFVASWLLILIGNAYGIFGRGSEVFGVEFAGGEKITLTVDQEHKPSVDHIREVASKASGAEVLVAYQRDISTGKDTLLVTARESGNEAVANKIFTALKQAFPDAGFGDQPSSIDRVGAIVGREIKQTAVLASLLAMFGILIYVAFRYEFSFAIGAVVAIIHDILMTLGCYFLAGREINATTVAAILTIIGFSINDTIVIFDRIREDLRLGIRGTFRELVNQALNQTLSRTIITSGTVFLATGALYLFGGGPINDFAFCFLVGIITGTYSSIYIASALVLWIHKGQRPKLANAQLQPAAASSPVRG